MNVKVSLVVSLVSLAIEENFRRILDYIKISAEKGAEMIIFPEASLTGLLNNGNVEHDLDLSVEIPGGETNRISEIVRKYGVYVAIGLLERDGGKIYDSSILINPEGKLVLKYRRISDGWLDPNADRKVYSTGKDLAFVRTEFGKITFLICGDLFDDGILKKVEKSDADYVIIPMARSFEDCSFKQEKWDVEKMAYLKRMRRIPGVSLLVNYLSHIDCSFGGAMIIKDERIIAEKEIGKEGILLAEI